MDGSLSLEGEGKRRAALRLPGLRAPQLINALIATRPSGVCSQRGALSVSA